MYAAVAQILLFPLSKQFLESHQPQIMFFGLFGHRQTSLTGPKKQNKTKHTVASVSGLINKRKTEWTSLLIPRTRHCVVAGLSVRWAAFQTADACLSLLCCLHPLKKKKKEKSIVLCATSSLPIHTVTLAVFGNASTLLLQPCTDMKPLSTDRNPWRVCAIWVCVKFSFSVSSFSSQTSLHSNTEFPGYNLDTAINSSEQLYMLPPSTNSEKDTGGTSSEAADQASLRLSLCSEGPVHLTIELHSLVYHFQHIREQKQLKAKEGRSSV